MLVDNGIKESLISVFALPVSATWIQAIFISAKYQKKISG
jgi:hypothetical protein